MMRHWRWTSRVAPNRRTIRCGECRWGLLTVPGSSLRSPISTTRRRARSRARAPSPRLCGESARMGERVTIYDRIGEGFAWGQLNRDGYVGWLPDSTLAKPTGKPTHKITALRTFAFPGPSIKLPPVDTLVMGATIAVIREDGAFAVTRDGWHLPLPHVGRIDRHADDFVGVAEQFAGTPYLWGGKSRLGIDCSGLVQVSLNAAGTGCPRDSDMQQDSLGRALDASESKRLQRGDRICWERHVPLVANRATIAPAN